MMPTKVLFAIVSLCTIEKQLQWLIFIKIKTSIVVFMASAQ
jgi:hypothetical protein